MEVEDAVSWGMEQLSSEDEEDRRHPDSLRAMFKRVLLEAAPLPDAGVGELLRGLERLQLRGAPETPRGACEGAIASPRSSRPCEGALASPQSPLQACEGALASLSLSHGGAPCLERRGFACALCGHVFSLRRTRDLHAKACTK